MNHMNLFLASALISALVSSQSDICIWGKTGPNRAMNGLYSYNGGSHSGKQLFESNTPGCITMYLYWDTFMAVGRPQDGLPGWFIDVNIGNTAQPIAYCIQTTILTDCSEWYVYTNHNGEYSTAPQAMTFPDSCPEWQCDSISIPGLTDCDVIFDDHPQGTSSVWQNTPATRWWYFNFKEFHWECVDKFPINYCGESDIANTVSGWKAFHQSSMSMMFQTPLNTSYTVHCHNASHPSAQPTEVPSQSPLNICENTFMNVSFQYQIIEDSVVSDLQITEILSDVIPVFISGILLHLTECAVSEYSSDIQLSANNYANINILLCLICSGSASDSHVLSNSDTVLEIGNAVSETNLLKVNTETIYIHGSIMEVITTNVPISTLTVMNDSKSKNNIFVIEIILLIAITSVIFVLLFWFGSRYFLKKRRAKRIESETIITNIKINIDGTTAKQKEMPPKQTKVLPHSNSELANDTIEDTEITFENTNTNADKTTEALLIKIWLTDTVGFPQYFEKFTKNGYDSMEIISAIEAKKDLSDIGITLLGHQTKLLFEIHKIQTTDGTCVEKEGVQASVDRAVDTIVFEERKMNDAESDCSDTDSNAYENGYGIRGTVSKGVMNDEPFMNRDYGMTVTSMSMGSDKAYPMSVSKGYEMKAYPQSRGMTVSSIESDKAYPQTKSSMDNDKAYPQTMSKGNGFVNDVNGNEINDFYENITKNGNAFPMRTSKGNDKAMPTTTGK